MDAPFGYENYQRGRPTPPDQAQRLDHDEHGVGRPRRARPWLVAVAGLLVIAAFVVILATGGGETSEPGGDVVVESP